MLAETQSIRLAKLGRGDEASSSDAKFVRLIVGTHGDSEREAVYGRLTDIAEALG